MSRLLTVARVLALVGLLNFISGTFLVICDFKRWDVTAFLITFLLSCTILQVEIFSKWNFIRKETFINALTMFIVVGGTVAFFWFFHMIYKIAHYQGDYTGLLWSMPTRIIAFVVSIQLIVRSYREYKNLTLELMDELLNEDATPLSKESLSIEINTMKNNNKEKDTNPA